MKQKQGKHSVKRVISAVVTFCLIVIILLSLVIVVKTTLTEDPSVFGFRFFYIISGSMEPTIPMGAAVVTKRQSTYAIGDVITFCSDDPAILNCPNTHRIVSVTKTDYGIFYQTQGDANTIPDTELVKFNDVYGKVIFVTPSLTGIGDFLEYLLTPSGFFILLVVPMLLITVFSMKMFTKSYHTAMLQQEHKMQNEQPIPDKTVEASSQMLSGQPEPKKINEMQNENEKGSGDTL